MSKEAHISKYVLKFGMTYMIGIIILSAIFISFSLNHSSAASIVVLIGAAFSTAAKFVQDRERIPSKKEKTKLIWSSFLMSWLVIILLYIGTAFAIGGQQAVSELVNTMLQVDPLKISGAIVLISLVFLSVFFVSYGKLAQIQFNMLEKIEKKGERKRRK